MHTHTPTPLQQKSNQTAQKRVLKPSLLPILPPSLQKPAGSIHRLWDQTDWSWNPDLATFSL